MVCIVTGFPSNIAALQFEWAWQNAHLTRKIPTPQRLTTAETSQTSLRSGRTRRRPVRPRVCLTDRLGNLHLLLRVQSFIRWPLEVRFFSEDVHQIWLRWTEREVEKLRDGIKIILDLKRELPGVVEEADAIPPSSQIPGRRAKKAKLGNGGIEGLDVGFGPLKQHAEKSIRLLSECKALECAVCHGEMDQQRDLVATCSTEDCMATSHLTCLSRHFLTSEGEKRLLLPTQGTCPGCLARLRWADIIKELTLRVRGRKDLEKLLKKPQRRPGKKSNSGNKDIISLADVGEDGDSESEDSTIEDREDEVPGLRASDGAGELFPYHEYFYIDDGDDDDLMSVASAASESSEAIPPDLHATSVQRDKDGKGLDIVIGDSDWDDAEVLD
ncbi:hypothetical protein FGG08_003770 [Glutinoglossum americanum]|uniref:Structure-specific endonuclease subunit SLX1 C-terminal domain-containing protein n=1 Tax=Glutinoglossum americanum TaxID=1670608 RepID=A0A9P8L4G4_9PEZI|nr:hypothetical protein FGG08_003770 [Glutinoglossum americanum]